MAGRFSSNAAVAAAIVAAAAVCAVVAATRAAPAAAQRPSSSPEQTIPDVARADEPRVRPTIALVPSGDPLVTAQLASGITRALDEARAAGGPDLALVVGSASSGWASVASEAVRFACDERALALVAPPERALAHPVAQAATRCGVPVISTSAAESVTAAGSRFVVSVATDGATPADAGYDAARVIVEAVRRRGLSREAVIAAATDGTPVTGATGPIRFGPLGRRETAAR